jgi:DNA-binding MarR family transcriptional regulator
VAKSSATAKNSPRTRADAPAGSGVKPRALRHAAELDRVIHEPVRLGIISALAANVTLSFRELKDLLRTTDGNLSVHARKLEQASYISCTKHFEGRMPKTKFRITAAGRRALEDYLRHMEQLIHAARER